MSEDIHDLDGDIPLMMVSNEEGDVPPKTARTPKQILEGYSPKGAAEAKKTMDSYLSTHKDAIKNGSLAPMPMRSR